MSWYHKVGEKIIHHLIENAKKLQISKEISTVLR